MWEKKRKKENKKKENRELYLVIVWIKREFSRISRHLLLDFGNEIYAFNRFFLSRKHIHEKKDKRKEFLKIEKIKNVANVKINTNRVIVHLIDQHKPNKYASHRSI